METALKKLPPLPSYTRREELASSITHGVGIVLAIVGLSVLVAFAMYYGDVWHVLGCSIFGAALILCFTTSTLYHSIQVERIKRILRTCDHTAIFLLIAATYTPFMLVNLRGPWGWSLFAGIWSLAALGITLRLLLRGRCHGLMVSIYILMGWVIVIATKPLLAHVGKGGCVLLALGGLAYMVGVGFYKWRHLPYNHAIWHGCVLAGSGLHFFAVFFYVIPRPGIS